MSEFEVKERKNEENIINKEDLFGIKGAYKELYQLLEEGKSREVAERIEKLMVKAKAYKDEEIQFKLLLMKAYLLLKQNRFDDLLSFFEQELSSFIMSEEVKELAIIAIERMLSQGKIEGEKLIDLYLNNPLTEKDINFWTNVLLFKALASFQNRGDVFSAVRYFNKLLDLEEKIEDNDYLKCKIYSDYGVFLEVTGKTKEAQKCYEKARDFSQNLDDYQLEAEIEMNLGILRFNMADWEEAYFHFKRALSLFDETVDISKVAQLETNLGYTAFKTKKYNTALQYYEKALDKFLSQKNFYEAADILSLMGELYEEKGELELAEKYFENALSILSERLGENKETAFIFIIILKELAFLKERTDELEKEEKYLERALDLARRFSLPREEFGLAIELSRLKMNSGELAEASSLLKEAQDKTFILKDKSEYGSFYENYALLNFLKKNLDESLKYAKMAYDVYNSYHKPKPLARVSYLMGKIYSLKGDIGNAHGIVDLAINICKYEKLHHLLYECYLLKSELYHKENNSRSSNIYKSYAYQLKREYKF